MKHSLSFVGLAFASLCGLFAVPTAAAQTPATTVGAHANHFFRAASGTAEISTPRAAKAPAAPAAQAKAPAAAVKAADGTDLDGIKIYGLQKVGTSTGIASFTVAESVSVTTEVDVTMAGSITWLSGSFNGTSFYAVGNAYGSMDMAFNYSKDSNWAMLGNNYSLNPSYMVDLTYNPAESQTYGIFSDASGSSCTFGTYNCASLTKTAIATLSQKFVSVASDGSANSYAIGADGNLYTISNTTGQETLVGPTGVTPGSNASSACFNNEGTVILWIESEVLYAIDPATGSASKVTDVAGEWKGLFVEPAKPVITPSWIDDLTLAFTADALTGNVEFKMPTKDVAGNAISCTMQYHIAEGETEIASGDAGPGQSVRQPVTLTEGTHDITVYASVDGNAGWESTRSAFIGHDTPCAPANLTVTDNDGIISLSWSSVRQGENGGYVNIDAMTYSVKRLPDNAVIADTRWTSAVDETLISMGKYAYVVEAFDGVKRGTPAQSEFELLGEALGITPPYEYTFGEEGLGLFTAINANNDEYQWTHDKEMNLVWLMSNPAAASDDWLISPQIKLETGCHYNLRMILQGSQYLENQRFEIRMGKGNTPEQMETVLVSPTDFNYACILNKLLSPQESGEYYIGLHVITPAVNGAIAISHFSVGSPIRGAAPNVAANLLIQAAEKGGKSASIRFDAPKRTFDGDPIDVLTKIIVKNLTTGRTVKEFENPAPGQELTTTDDQPAEGSNTYAVISTNAAGDGPAAEASAWIGLDSPSAPTNVSWQQNGNEVTLTWSAPTTGTHRGYVDPEGFSYKIINNTTKETVKEDVRGLTATLTPDLDESTRQISLSYSVVAVNAAGEGTPGKSNTSAFGRGYEAPFAESFELAQTHTSPWLIENVEGTN